MKHWRWIPGKCWVCCTQTQLYLPKKRESSHSILPLITTDKTSPVLWETRSTLRRKITSRNLDFFSKMLTSAKSRVIPRNFCFLPRKTISTFKMGCKKRFKKENFQNTLKHRKCSQQENKPGLLYFREDIAEAQWSQEHEEQTTPEQLMGHSPRRRFGCGTFSRINPNPALQKTSQNFPHPICSLADKVCLFHKKPQN